MDVITVEFHNGQKCTNRIGVTTLWLPQSLFISWSFIVIFYFQEWDEIEFLDTEVLKGPKV
jgi:hypothetical protein